MEWVNEIKQLLADGLYPDNLRRIIECCERGLKEGQHVLPAYVIRSVIGDLQRDWEGRAVLVAEARRTETELRPLLEAVAAGLLRGDSLQAMSAPLDTLVRAWVFL